MENPQGKETELERRKEFNKMARKKEKTDSEKRIPKDD
jgi:hypothetical protein